MKRRLWFLIFAAVAAGAAVFLVLPKVSVLTIRDEGGRIRARLICEDGTFVHRFVHSVHLSDVDEEYTIEADGSLRLTATRFDTLGVGIPSDAEGGFSQEGNRFVLRMDRRYRSLPIRVSPLPGHVILTGGRVYPLSTWIAPEDLAILEARIIPRIGVLVSRREGR